MRRLLPQLITASALLLALTAPAAQAEIREVGVSAEAPLPDPSCPSEPCTAIARVTGYPVQVGTVKNPMLLNEPGKIVAFTLKLGKPNETQSTFFSSRFGAQAQVRLSILKPARSKYRHRLLDQSAVFEVNTFFGSNPTFALDKPLIVKKRNVVALTVITWAPSFASALDNTNAWRFSRAGDCDDSADQAAQQTLASLRTFACFRRTSRPLYSATFIPDNKVTNPPTTTENTGDTNDG
jgi:hypothetical protein